MTISVNPPPLQLPPNLVTDKPTLSFYNSLLSTIYQLWSAVYGLESSATVKTTDATQTGLIRTSVKEDTVTMIRASIVARRTGGASGTDGDGAFYVLTGAYKNIGGSLSGIGTADLVGGEDQTAWNVGFSSSGTDVVVIVQGAAGNDITWNGTINVYSVGS